MKIVFCIFFLGTIISGFVLWRSKREVSAIVDHQLRLLSYDINNEIIDKSIQRDDSGVFTIKKSDLFSLISLVEEKWTATVYLRDEIFNSEKKQVLLPPYSVIVVYKGRVALLPEFLDATSMESFVRFRANRD